jgi:nicotinate-nucleotide pyrophosphorylase (carboxylating)
VRLLDTRKTLPGLRAAQKYAVRCGGCHNHRMGLYDAFLIKENHILACGSIHAADPARPRVRTGETRWRLKWRTLDELAQAINAGAERVMLDNFELGGHARGGTHRRRPGGTRSLGQRDPEDTLRPIAETGVELYLHRRADQGL